MSVFVNNRDGYLYNVSKARVTDVPGYTTSLTVSNPTRHAMVDDIGSGQIVTFTANFTAGGPLVGTTSQCSYMVNVEGISLVSVTIALMYNECKLELFVAV